MPTISLKVSRIQVTPQCTPFSVRARARACVCVCLCTIQLTQAETQRRTRGLTCIFWTIEESLRRLFLINLLQAAGFLVAVSLARLQIPSQSLEELATDLVPTLTQLQRHNRHRVTNTIPPYFCNKLRFCASVVYMGDNRERLDIFTLKSNANNLARKTYN